MPDGIIHNEIIEDPPAEIIGPTHSDKPWLSRKGRRIDFARRDAMNRHLAGLGEEFVVLPERHRLRQAGRDDLSQKVRWVSVEIGDGLGFDVLPFDDVDESEKLIEVKTTGLGKFFPFYVTANEDRSAQESVRRAWGGAISRSAPFNSTALRGTDNGWLKT